MWKCYSEFSSNTIAYCYKRKNSMTQPPYSPNLAPCDFFLFPKWKEGDNWRDKAGIEEPASKHEKRVSEIFRGLKEVIPMGVTLKGTNDE